MVINSAKLDSRTKQHTQFGVSASNGSRDTARTKSWWKKKEREKKKGGGGGNEREQSHIVSPTGITNKEINEANCMLRNSAKLDRRTKQHTQSGVSTSDGSRDMARTKSWRKKKKKKKKTQQSHIESPTGIANYQGLSRASNTLLYSCEAETLSTTPRHSSLEKTETKVRQKVTH